MEVMLDNETLSLYPNAYLLSIGACKFDPAGVKEKFYAIIKPKNRPEFHIDPSTVNWWFKATDEARAALRISNPESLEDALQRFAVWIADVQGGIWGNGSDFDNKVLEHAYQACGMKTPWSYKQNRCYRTLKSLCPSVGIDHENNHVAVDDAVNQANHLIEILKELNIPL